MMLVRLQVVIVFLVWSASSYALTFSLPTGRLLFGEIQSTKVGVGEDFSDIAERFDIGYYEVFEANPGIDPDEPPVGAPIIIPTQYILPVELKRDVAVINLAEMRLYYKPKVGNNIYVFPVGIGKEGWETPLGNMSIVQKKENPTWRVPESIYSFRKAAGEELKRVVAPGPDNPLGKYALRLSNRKYLIHGTNDPSGVGRRSTAGCIRMYPDDIKRLYGLVDIGTKVIIINQPYKAAWQNKKLYLEAHMPLSEQRRVLGDDIKPALDVVSKAVKGRKIKVDWDSVRKIVKDHWVFPREV